MPTHYTEKQKAAALEQLHIQPDSNGRITSTEAARILTWRAKREYGVTHVYTTNAVRKHKEKLDTQPLRHEDGTINTRLNTVNVDKVFALDIVPARTNSGRHDGEDKVLTR